MRLRHRLRVTASVLALAALATAASAVATQQPGPSVQITSEPPKLSNSANATFTFTSQSANVTFECSIDEAPGAACPTPYTTPTLANGSHTFTVTAIGSGGRGDPASYTWTVDTTPPTVTITPTPGLPPVTNTTSANFGFSSDKSGTTFQCALDAAALADCTSPAPYTGLADGSHTFHLQATDPAGNTTTGSYTWTVETTPPQTTITSTPPSAARGDATFSFTSDKTDVTFTCWLDGVPTSPCPPPVSYHGLADGVHMFQVQATDQATNVGPAAVYSWTVDTTSPDLSISGGPPSASASSTATFVFSSHESDVTFSCSLDGGAYEPCGSPEVYEGLGDGSHAFNVEAVDAAGNVGGPVTYNWIVDTTPPAGVSGLRARVSYRQTTLVWKLPTDADFDHVSVFEHAPRGTKAVVAYTGKATSYKVTLDNSRTYRYDVVSYDSLGNSSGPVTVSIPPDALLLTPRDGAAVGRSPAFEWTPAPGARFYNIQLYRNGKKILSTWPRSSYLRLASHWLYAGHERHLARGRYQWYVWPAFGVGRSAHYGAVLGISSFRVG
jgi:hypothetical protein